MIRWSYAVNLYKPQFDDFTRRREHARALRVISASGFDAVELQAGTGRWEPLGNPTQLAANHGSVAAFGAFVRAAALDGVSSWSWDPLTPFHEDLTHGTDPADPAARDGLVAHAVWFAAALAELGGSVLVARPCVSAGRLPGLDDATVAALAQSWEQVGAAVARHGVRLGLHHDFLCALRLDDGLERLLAATDPELVGLALDTAEFAVSGLDPVVFYERHADRVVHVQLKNASTTDHLEEYRQPAAEYEVLRAGGSRRVPRWFLELGAPDGVVDSAAMVRALARHGYDGWVVVESELTPHPATSVMLNGWEVQHVLAPLLTATPASAAPPVVEPALEPAVDVDVVVVGSGPVGSTFARVLHDEHPELRVLVLEAGPRLTRTPGVNVRNVADPVERDRLQRLAEGLATDADDATRRRWSPRPGTHRLVPRDPDSSNRADSADSAADQDDLPDASASTNVGGMGAHWTCACPPPGGAERIDLLPDDEWDALLDRGRVLLAVTTAGFDETPAVRAALAGLSAAFDAGRPADRRVQPMPLACTPRPGATPTWSGADTVLGPLATGEVPTFELRDRTTVLAVRHRNGHAHGVLADGPDGRYEVRARAVVVAADALRTPQLLWASGIRPPALGRYLNDQPQVISAVVVPLAADAATDTTGTDAVAGNGRPGTSPQSGRDRLAGVSWVPYVDGLHPYHGQVMQLDASPIDLGVTDQGAGAVVGLGWFCAKQPRADDRVEFDEADPDPRGLPGLRIRYRLTAEDLANVEGAKAAQRRAAAHLGGFVPGGEPRLLPAGTSLHYQGTTRMGRSDDGSCVVDPTSRVWGFDNLWLGGNGVIPTATACNPTLTSVALAVRGARALGASLAAPARSHPTREAAS